MSDLEQKIERCKQEIRYHADYMCLPYDDKDIVHITLPDGHTIVMLREIYAPDFERDEDYWPYPILEIYAKKEKKKEPIIWVEYPWHDRVAEHRTWREQGTMFVPRVVIRFPQLVYLILPDGTVKKHNICSILENIAKQDIILKSQEIDQECADMVSRSMENYP